MILDILKLPSPKKSVLETLRAKSVDAVLDATVKQLCENMVETMLASNGVGLAAPQVGCNLNIFVMRTLAGIEADTREHLVIINPTSLETGGDLYSDEEGCLSIPGLLGSVRRYKALKCLSQGFDTPEREIVLEGLEARIFQHEQDHLKGILFIDRADPATFRRLVKKVNKS